jgi:hypothetical protein
VFYGLVEGALVEGKVAMFEMIAVVAVGLLNFLRQRAQQDIELVVRILIITAP